MAVEFEYSALRGFIRRFFGTNAAFAKFLGIGVTALYERLGNRVPFSQEEIARVATQSPAGALSAKEVYTLFFTVLIWKVE